MRAGQFCMCSARVDFYDDMTAWIRNLNARSAFRGGAISPRRWINRAGTSQPGPHVRTPVCLNP